MAPKTEFTKLALQVSLLPDETDEGSNHQGRKIQFPPVEEGFL